MRVMENLKNKNSEIKTNVETPQVQNKTAKAHHKVLKHSFFAFLCLFLLGSLLLIVGLYTNISDTWTNIEHLIKTKGKTLFEGLGGLDKKRQVLHIIALIGATVLMVDGMMFFWVLFLAIKKLFSKS